MISEPISAKSPEVTFNHELRDRETALEGARYFGGPATSDPARQLF